MPRGGKRPGAGRKPTGMKRRYVAISDEQARLLRMWGRGDLSAGLRWLIDAAAPLICKPTSEPQPPASPSQSKPPTQL